MIEMRLENLIKTFFFYFDTCLENIGETPCIVSVVVKIVFVIVLVDFGCQG